MIVFGVLGFGLVPTLGMSMTIVGFGGFGMESMMAMSQAGAGGTGHAIAGVIGGALLWAVAASLVGQVYLLGLSLVYLRVTEGLDLTASEEALRATFDDAKRRTAEFGEKARQATQRDTAAGASAATGAAAGSTLATGAATAPAPVYNPPPAYSPPPAFAPAPHGLGEEATQHDAPSGDPDIALPFDEPPPAPAVPSYAAPPAWTPPPTAAAPRPALPAAAPLPAPTTCAQCLSPVSPDDVFCGVCGYRLK